MGTHRQRLRAIVTAMTAFGVFLVLFWIYFHAAKQPQINWNYGNYFVKENDRKSWP
jgi:hypothetical protein